MDCAKSVFTLALALGLGCGDSTADPDGTDDTTTSSTTGTDTTTDASTTTGADTTASTGSSGPVAESDSSTTSGSTDSSGGVDPVCGDAMAQGSEECDGEDLGDALSCASVDARLDGPLQCTPRCTYDLSACEPAIGMGVSLNELTSSPDDDIEIHHAGSADIDLSGWILTDDISDPRAPYDPDLDPQKYVFPKGTILAPGEFLVVVQGVGIGHPFGLSSSGDTVTLLMPDLVVIDHVSYEDGEAAFSYCRLPDGPGGAWTADCMPTFGEANLE